MLCAMSHGMGLGQSLMVPVSDKHGCHACSFDQLCLVNALVLCAMRNAVPCVEACFC